MTVKRFRRIFAGLLSTALFVQAAPVNFVPADAAGEGIAIYVSPDGDDSADGSATSPLRTLSGARDKVRKICGDMDCDITVYLHGGDYRISEPVVFDTRDSATNGFHINYTAYPGETPVINGASKVTGWEKSGDKLYVADLDRDVKLRNLYVNDHRARMGSVTLQSKGGVGTYSVTAGQASWAWDSGSRSDGIAYDINKVPRIPSNFDDVEIVGGTTWNENIVCTRDIKVENGSLVMYLQQPYGAIAQTPGWNAGFSTGGTHTLYNSLSFVDEPGEFYFDKTAHKLYYYPYAWEDMSSADVEAPAAEQLIVVAGKNLNERVSGLSFSGITFANTEYQLTEVAGSHGKATCQAAQSYIAFADSNWHKRKYEMADTFPAAVNITSSTDIVFRDNVIKHTGADGLSMSNDVTNASVTGNFITDITSSGITVSHPQHVYIGDASWDNHEKFPKDVEGVCKNIEISDNLLYQISVVHGFGGCAAITAYYADSVKILRNTIRQTAYNGIHLGWGWCNFTDSKTCQDNMVCYNRVIDSLNRLHDSGGIYTIGQMPGTVINENYVQGIPAAAQWQPTYGLHNDEGTAYVEELNNVLEISPNVTYTINCEDYGKKHHLTIKGTYATVCKMGVNPPDSQIDKPIVVSDNVWALPQYKICLNSGVTDEYRALVREDIISAADYAFPASCETTAGSNLPIRKAGNIVWIAPDGTESFKKGADMTRASAFATSIRTPEIEGNYRIYVTDVDGRILSKSSHILRLKGTSSGGDVIEAESYDLMKGINNEDCSEGGKDVAYIENGDYIGFKGIDLTGATSADFRIGSNVAEAALEMHVDSPDGRIIGKMDVSGTGGWQKWTTQSCKVDAPTGVHDVYLVFTGESGYLFNVNWWRLGGVSAEGKKIILGDLDGNGVVNVFDMAEMRESLITGDCVNFDEADMNDNGAIEITDALMLQKYLFGL